MPIGMKVDSFSVTKKCVRRKSPLQYQRQPPNAQLDDDAFVLKTFTRLNGNTLYLITVATFYRIITSPRTIDFAMGYMFATFLLFKNFDNLLYVLYVVLLCYRERIFSLNYNKVINSYSADQ